MTMSTLMCPHCGGRLLIDPTQRLQSMLTCPYCARKSLMQKKNGMIVLHGIISQAVPSNTEMAWTDDSSSGLEESAQSPYPDKMEDHVLSESVQRTEITSDSVGSVVPDTAIASERSDVSFEPSVSDGSSISKEFSVSDEPMTVEEFSVPEEVHAIDALSDDETSVAIDDLSDNVASAAIDEPAVINEPDAFDEPALINEPDVIDEPALINEPDVVDEPAAMAVSPESAEAEPPAVSQKTRQDRLVDLASRAAASGQVMLFNSYARQAIDCEPTDPRAYVLRSRLIEEAHGFARTSFLSPVWMSQTPRQKAWNLAQHFASFNAAVAYSPETARPMLAADAGALIAWQIRESFVENARLRLGKRPFKGKFRRPDLGTAPRIIDACACINETVVPHVAGDLLRAIRLELERMDPRLAHQLQRMGF